MLPIYQKRAFRNALKVVCEANVHLQIIVHVILGMLGQIAQFNACVMGIQIAKDPISLTFASNVKTIPSATSARCVHRCLWATLEIMANVFRALNIVMGTLIYVWIVMRTAQSGV